MTNDYSQVIYIYFRQKLRRWILACVFLLQLSVPLGGADYSDWAYSRNIYVNTSSSGGGADLSTGLSDFPILVRLTSTSVDFSRAQTNGEDIRFSDSASNELSYEIERWNSGSEVAEIWVKMDTVKPAADSQYIIMYWDNDLVSSQSNPQAVFDTANGFYGVWHLNEDASGTGTSGLYQDATYNNYDGDDYADATGKTSIVGLGQELDGSNDRITMGDIISASWSKVTISMWVNLDVDQTQERSLLRKRTHLQLGLFPSDNEIRNLVRGPSNGWVATRDVAYTINTSTWYYFAFTYDDGVNELRNYAQGAQEGATATCDGLIVDDGSYDLHLGWCEGGSDGYIDGTIDEARLSNKARSPDWIQLCYETQKASPTCVTFGPVDTTVITYRIWDGGGTGGKWSNQFNWRGDVVPISTDKIKFDITSTKNCTLDISDTVTWVVFVPGYSGLFTFSSDTLWVQGKADFSTGGTLNAAAGVLRLSGGSLFTPKAGQTFPPVIKDGTGTTTIGANFTGSSIAINSGTLDLGTSLTHTMTSISGAGAIDFSSSRLKASGPALDFSSMSSVTAGTGVLECTGTSKQTLSPKSGATHPAIEHTGTDTLLIQANLKAVSFSQEAGVLDFNSKNIETTGDFDVSGGTSTTFARLTGCTLTVGGDATFIGTSGNELNMNTADTHYIDVNGSLNGSYCNIGRSNAGMGSEGLAASSINSSNNTNWNFDDEDYADWSYHRKVYFNTTSSGADMSADVGDFPIPLRFTSTNFTFSQAIDSGKDVRFSRPDGTHLSYEIERWDSTNQLGEVWLLVDNVEANNKTQSVVMHWGRAGETSNSSPSSVFKTSNGFTGVWHLTEEQAGTGTADVYLDATSNDFDGDDLTGQTGQDGVIGRGQEFDGTDDHIDAGDVSSSSWSAITVMAWVKPQTDQADERSLVRKDRQFQLGIFPADNEVRNLVETNGINGWTAANDEAFTINAGTWYHFAFTYANGSNLQHYGDGSQVGSDKTVSGSIDNNTNNMAIGATDGGTRVFDGFIDEVTVSYVARSADWIKLCYETQRPNCNAVNYLKPVVSGIGDSTGITAYQRDGDTGVIRYEVEDPDDGILTISAEYKTASGGSWAAIGSGSGEIGGGVDTSATEDKEIHWHVKTEPGAGIEGSYYIIQVIADDGTYEDTTASDSFVLDTRPPQGLADFRPIDSTNNSIRLGWTSATDANFNHYEIYYGTDRGQVQSKSSSEWDEDNDGNMSSASCANTWITGLSQGQAYYFKIWAVDDMANDTTIADTMASTISQVSPLWTKSSLGAITGGAISPEVIYITTGANKLYSIDITDGGVRWDYDITSPGRPTYRDYGSQTKVLVSGGTHIYCVRDDGAGRTEIFNQDVSASTGNPYGSPDDTTFYCAYTNNLGKFKMSDGTSVGGNWPENLANISLSADPVVFDDFVYVATTTGSVWKYDSDNTAQSECAVGATVEQPMLIDNGVLYVTPKSNEVFAINTSDMDTAWLCTMASENTGPAFKLPGSGNIYVASEDTVRSISSGSVSWSRGVADSVVSAPISSGQGTIYFGMHGGEYYAIDEGTQADKTDWPYTSAGGNATSGPWISDTIVVFGTSGNNLDAFRTK